MGSAVGLSVNYIAETHTAVLTSMNHTMRINLKDGKASLDDTALGVAPVILENGSTYLPFRWICERFEFEVGFENGIILIDTKGNSLIDQSVDQSEVVNEDVNTNIDWVKVYKTFGPKEYYIDYLANLRDMCSSAMDATREGFDEALLPAFQSRKKDSDEVKAKLKGTEYEQLAAKYDGLADQIVGLYMNNGAGIEKVHDKLYECYDAFYTEVERLGISNETMLAIYSRMSTLDKLYIEYVG